MLNMYVYKHNNIKLRIRKMCLYKPDNIYIYIVCI